MANKPIVLTNEDRTAFNPPENPLEEKWSKLYPPTPKPEYSQVCDGYSCIWCGRCPKGSFWVCPEEDKEVYEQYLKEYDEYIKKHNPSFHSTSNRSQENETVKLTLQEFQEQYCSNCGTQRCEGIDSDWFDGCEHKDCLMGKENSKDE